MNVVTLLSHSGVQVHIIIVQGAACPIATTAFLYYFYPRMPTDNPHIYRQVYHSRPDDAILAWTDQVIVVITRRGILGAAFAASGEVLALHYMAYKNDRPAWDLDFFEQSFNQEHLLTRREKIKKVFFCTERSTVIPDELYNRDEAEKWLRATHYIEPTDTIEHFELKHEYARYVYAVPVYMRELVNINCPDAEIMPLAACQLIDYNGQREALQCMIGAEQACVSWYKNNKLFWHRVFEYSNAEDLAYEIRLVCKEHNINAARLDVACNTMSATEYAVANELSRYFNGIYTGAGKPIQTVWDPVISLAQQLSVCA